MSEEENVAEWTRVTKMIMERDGVTQEQADAGLLWAIQDAADKGEVAVAVKVEAFTKVESALAELKVALGI